MVKTVKLVGDVDNPRAILFSDILKNLDNYSQAGRISSQINRDSDFSIVFNFKDLDTLKKLKIPVIPGKDEKFLIYDVSEDLFDHKKWGPLVTMLTVCSNYVTCADEVLQERIYEVTGRLSTIVRNPVNLEKLVEPVLNNTKDLLWYGTISDVFSVYKYKNNKDLTIALLNGKIAGDNVVTVKSQKKRDKLFKKFDVVFLPETPTIEGEIRRMEKIKECTLMGKAVIQQLETSLPTKKKLKENLAWAQQILIEEEGYESVVGQLEWALEQTPKDDYLEYVGVL